MRDSQISPKEANPLVWGAVGAIFALSLFALFDFFGTPGPEMRPATLILGGFFWGWAAGSVKNWLWNRKQP
jgi:hypothetical protein